MSIEFWFPVLRRTARAAEKILVQGPHAFWFLFDDRSAGSCGPGGCLRALSVGYFRSVTPLARLQHPFRVAHEWRAKERRHFIWCSMKIGRVFTIIVLVFGLAGCGAADLISNGLAYSRAVETDLEQVTSVRPEVGFNWHNGSFESVTVTFPRVYTGKSLDELAGAVREVVARDFKQAPDTIVLAFSLKQ